MENLNGRRILPFELLRGERGRAYLHSNEEEDRDKRVRSGRRTELISLTKLFIFYFSMNLQCYFTLSFRVLIKYTM